MHVQFTNKQKWTDQNNKIIHFLPDTSEKKIFFPLETLDTVDMTNSRLIAYPLT